MAPLNVKLSVSDSCVASSLCYAAETWADRGTNIETLLYRHGLRTALSVRQSVNNEIIYIETNKYPIKRRIMRQQLKFWLNVKEYINNNPDSAFYCFVKQAQLLNLKHIKHYELLGDTYITPDSCMRTIANRILQGMENQV